MSADFDLARLLELERDRTGWLGLQAVQGGCARG